MTTTSKTTTIGIFVITAVIMLVAGIVIFGSGRLFSPTIPYVAYFDGRLKGLNIGSPVLFRGVRVGSVIDIIVDVDPGTNEVAVPVIFEIEVDRFTNLHSSRRSVAYARSTVDRLIKNGLRARLEIESIVTGQMAIELDFSAGNEARYVARTDSGYDEFPTIPSTVDQLTASLKEIPIRDIMRKLQRVVEGLDTRINDQRLSSIIGSVDQAMGEITHLAAAMNSEVVPQLTEALEQIRQLSLRLRTGTADRLDTALDKAGTLMTDLNTDVPQMARELRDSLAKFSLLAEEATLSLASIRYTAGDDSDLMIRVDATLNELAEAARAVGRMADYIERHPESLLRGKNQP